MSIAAEKLSLPHRYRADFLKICRCRAAMNISVLLYVRKPTQISYFNLESKCLTLSVHRTLLSTVSLKALNVYIAYEHKISKHDSLCTIEETSVHTSI
jgi:hypothetical protein